MEFDEDENSIGGIVPEFGAIFMSNIATKRECFKRKIFGLPSAQVNFVKRVKAGMLLFLFEFERRELFGVFRATSDGAINIMPHAFSSSGKQFPAQVRFAPIWYCTPLSEIEFRNAISDNYYSAKKFNFGLSKNQVHILVQLFSSRRVNCKMPRRQAATQTREVGKDRQRVDNDMVMVTDTFEPDMGDYIRSATLNEYSEKSLDGVEGVDDDRFLMGDKVENEHKVDSSLGRRIWTDQPGVYWTKKRKINTDDRFLTSDATGSELYNNLGPWQSTSADCLGDSFGKIKSANDVWLSPDDRVTEYHITNNNLGPAISSECPRNSFNKGRRVTEDDKFMNEMIENKCHVDNDFGTFVSTENHEKPFGKGRLPFDDNRFSVTRYCVGNEHRMENGLRPVLSAEHLRNSQGKRPTDDNSFLMNSRLQNKRYVSDCIGSVNSTEHIGNSLGRVARANDVRNFLMSERAETDCSSQHFVNPMDKFRRETEDRLEIENNRDNGFGPGISTEFYRYTTLCKDKLLADDGRFRKSDRVENVRDIDSRIGPAFSSEITASCQSEQNLFMNSIKRNPSEQNLFTSSIKPNLESDNYLLHDQIQHSLAFLRPNGQQNFTKSYSTAHDATVSKTDPYNPEFPDVRYRCSLPLVASHNFNSVQDHSPHQGSEENFIPLSNIEGLTHLLESKRLARCLDVAAGNVNKNSSRNTCDHHNQLSYRSSNTFTNSGYRESSELRASESKGSKDSIYSDSILASPSFPNGRSTEMLNKGQLSYAFSSSKNPSFAFEKGYPEESQGKYELKLPQREDHEAFTAKEFHPSDAAWSYSSRLHYGSSPQDQAKNPVNHKRKLYLDTKNDRTSVFARLSVAPEVCLQEDGTDTDMVRDDCDIDASVDEVMDLLHQAHNHWVKVEKYRPNDGDSSTRYKEKSKFQKETEFEQPMVTKEKMEIDASRAIKENVDTVLKETRLIDFKRRSKIKKNLDENISEGSDGVSEGTTSVGNARPTSLMSKTSANATDEGLLGKAGKSGKLIRPDFSKTECPDESKNGDSIPYARLPFEECSYKNNTASCKDALKSLESTDVVSCNAGVAHATLPATSDDNTTSEQAPVCKLSGNSKM